jgi:hypothetical protein
MWTFKTGDLIAKNHPAIKTPLQVGLVIAHDIKTFTIKWTSYNKVFFMEKEEDIFAGLNKSFLLDTVQVYRGNQEINLSLLNSSYSDGEENQKTP